MIVIPLSIVPINSVPIMTLRTPPRPPESPMPPRTTTRITSYMRVELKMRVGIELTDAARTRPAKQPISAASTYCRTMIGRVGIPVTRAAFGLSPIE